MARTLIALLAALALIASGCGGGDDGGDGGGGSDKPAAASPTEAADKFIDCFDKQGYEAVHPEAGQESLFALQAKKSGYDAVAVNVAKPGSIAADAYLVFFKDEAEAQKALDDVGVQTAGDTPPLERGQAIAGYLDDDAKSTLEPAITNCL